MPVIAFSLLVLVAYLAFSIDVSRELLAVKKLQFAASAAGLYAYSHLTLTAENADLVKENIKARIKRAALSKIAPINNAPWGAAGSFPDEKPVFLKESDIAFVENPADGNELLLQVTARREAGEILKMCFLPGIFAANVLHGDSVPQGAIESELYRTIEVVGQPASRVGAGAPRQAPAGSKEAELAGYAVFPLAVLNDGFSQAAITGATTEYVIDLVTDKSTGSSLAPYHLAGCFVNDFHLPGRTDYYGDSQGDRAISELISLLKYFAQVPDKDDLEPGVVERGSELPAYNASDPKFLAAKSQVIAALKQMQLPRPVILPVINGNSVDFANRTTNKVVGFAYLNLVKAVNGSGTDFDLRLSFENMRAVCVRNTCCHEGNTAVPLAQAMTILPAPVPPFGPRAYDPETNSIARAARGVALAPVLSPRQLKP